MNKIQDKSNDARYFTLVPRIVSALCRTPYDLALWEAVKTIAGERGECYLSTKNLAVLAMMSTGQVSKSRAYLLEQGLLAGEVRKDPGYPQPVWHLYVPDLWSRNIVWAEKHLPIQSRLDFKKSLHQVKPSPSDGGVTPSDGGVSPGETKKKQKKKKKELPAPEKAQGDYFTMSEWEPEYHELEEEKKGRPKWQVPENSFQHQILGVCGARWFKPRQKTLVKKLAKCLEIGEVLSEAGCLQRCLTELQGCTDFPERPLAMPNSWLTWRFDHARSHRWSVQGLINALFDRDALVRHCQVMLKKKGIKPSAADEETPPGMVRVLSEDGIRYITEEEAQRI